ncbi:MAG: cysteine--tRNA ligase [Deltaproteobacteria bacterium]|nr:cysteine--tRNA ligase [Deltaproteobacteria bacterium]
MDQKQKGILDQIGNTPLVSISRLSPNKDVRILAKLESFNPGGSIKDRPALYMIEEAEKTGSLTKDKIILEATSGNTGIGLALVAAVKGYRILLTMSESVSEERVKILRAMGAEIMFTPARLGTDGAIEYVYSLVRKEPDKYWIADQFNNNANWMAHYYGTAAEIWDQTGGEFDFIVATMGTTGTLMGLSRRLKELKPEIQIIGVEPYLGHKIQGLKNMKESYQPGIYEKNRLDRIVHIDDEEAYQTSRRLAKKEGIFAGMSSGAAMAAAIRLASEIDRGKIVVILPDTGERYLSTPLFVTKKKSGLQLYNTISRRKEEFIPIEENRVSMYSCGPTLYRLINLGQCRHFVFSDLLRRYMELKGYEVTHIINVTDLDDRTIQGSEKAGEPLGDFTEKYYQAFMEDLAELNIKRASKYPRANEHVEDMVNLTGKLLEKGYAYEKFHSIYFDISRFKDYGRLSRIDLEKIRIGKTVDLDQYEKDNPRDFTLFKRSTLNELKGGVFFQTKWGNVRPGWHLECSAMAMKYLGPSYDIHTSGVNLVFPHHDNIIAISQAVTDRPLANYWIHNEMVMTDEIKGARIPESETPSLRDLLSRGFTGREIRYWLLSRHYRKPIYFSPNKLNSAKNTVNNLDNFVQKLHFSRSAPLNPDTDQAIYDLRHGFEEAMDDDFNISSALASLFQFTRRIDRMIDANGISDNDRTNILKELDRINSVLGVIDLEPVKAEKNVELLIGQREEARKSRDWKKADSLRDELKKMGIDVIDTRNGPMLYRAGT